MKPSFLKISIDLLCLQVAQLPRSPDLASSVLSDKQIDIHTADRSRQTDRQK